MAEKTFSTSWREIAISVYKAPSDSRIYGMIDVDVTDALEYIQEQRKSGNKVTLTHMVAAALARTLYEDVPEINCYVKRGKIRHRENADVFITVALKGGQDLTGVIVPRAQELSVTELAKYVNEEIIKNLLKQFYKVHEIYILFTEPFIKAIETKSIEVVPEIQEQPKQPDKKENDEKKGQTDLFDF